MPCLTPDVLFLSACPSLRTLVSRASCHCFSPRRGTPLGHACTARTERRNDLDDWSSQYPLKVPLRASPLPHNGSSSCFLPIEVFAGRRPAEIGEPSAYCSAPSLSLLLVFTFNGFRPTLAHSQSCRIRPMIVLAAIFPRSPL